MTLYFLDSSALAKLFVAELGSAQLVDLIKPLLTAQVVISTLAIVEVHSAIRRRERAGQLSSQHAAEALVMLPAEAAAMTEQPISTQVIETARQVLDRHPLRSLDAIQLASGLVARASNNTSNIVFVASDRVLLSAARAEGFQVWDPEN